jgi:hypothetical protein
MSKNKTTVLTGEGSGDAYVYSSSESMNNSMSPPNAGLRVMGLKHSLAGAGPQIESDPISHLASSSSSNQPGLARVTLISGRGEPSRELTGLSPSLSESRDGVLQREDARLEVLQSTTRLRVREV